VLQFTTTFISYARYWIGVYPQGGGRYVAWAWIAPAGLKGTASFPGTTLPKEDGKNYFFRFHGGAGVGDSKPFKFTVKPPTPATELHFSTSLDLNGLTREFTGADADLGDDGGVPIQYQTAICTKNSWILYAGKNYNDDSAQKKIQMIHEGQVLLLRFQPKSVRPLPSTPDAVTVYEHKNFGGKSQTITKDTDALTEFPVSYDANGKRNEAGVSSLYISDSKAWKFFTGPKFSGQSFILNPAHRRYYKSPQNFFGLDECIQSIQKVD